MSAAGNVVGSSFGRNRRRSPRAVLLTAIVAAHLAAILALLAPSTLPEAVAPERALSIFDVVPPPPPPPPPPRQAVATAETRTLAAGGSPGRRREPPATPVRTARDAAPRQFEATITADALPLPPSGQVVDATGIDLGLGTGVDAGGGSDGRGTGTGRGAGRGDGDGFARYARAAWITKPKDADFYRVWPMREANGKRVRQPGWAYLACKVKPDGQPYDCRTLYETPKAIGMGAAAIDVATRARVRPVFRNGVALPDLPVLIPIVFGQVTIRIPRVSEAVSVPPAR